MCAVLIIDFDWFCLFLVNEGTVFTRLLCFSMMLPIILPYLDL